MATSKKATTKKVVPKSTVKPSLGDNTIYASTIDPEAPSRVEDGGYDVVLFDGDGDVFDTDHVNNLEDAKQHARWMLNNSVGDSVKAVLYHRTAALTIINDL